MKFFNFHLMPYAHADLDAIAKNGSAWVTYSNSHYDPEKGAELYHDYLDQMEFAEIPAPEPKPGEIRIKNRAAALNFFDILLIQGKYQSKPPRPFTPGSEIAGVVDAVGEGVTGFKIGDRVQAMATGGTYCEYSIATAEKAFRIPDAMSFEEAAAMIVIYQTSYFALTHRAPVMPGAPRTLFRAFAH